MFHSRKQLQGEPIEQFVSDLKLKTQTCQFENLKDSMIRDRLVLGVTNTRVRERLLREENLNLDKAVKICQAAEATERQIQTLSTEKGASSSDVNYCQNTGRRQHGKSQQKISHATFAHGRSGRSCICRGCCGCAYTVLAKHESRCI